jgi:hypothetical protein
MCSYSQHVTYGDGSYHLQSGRHSSNSVTCMRVAETYKTHNGRPHSLLRQVFSRLRLKNDV